jgi:hypothetical protein
MPDLKTEALFVLFSLFALACSVPEHKAQSPYPPSPVISGVTWDASTHKTFAPGSDNWPTTWAEDGHLYAAWGDGGGFGGTNSEGRVSLGIARIEGPWDKYIGYNVWGGKNPKNPYQFKGKSYGLLSLDAVLYMWVMVEGEYYKSSQIAWSTDRAATFKQGFTFEEPDAAFSAPTFLNFGKDYSGARDDYVYVYSGLPLNNCTDKCIGESVDLARVPKDKILSRSAYQFFQGLDLENNPTWTSDISRRRPVFNDPDGAGTRFGVVYNPGLQRYLLTIAHDNGGGLGIFDGPEPWGPWTTVAYYTDWLGFGYSPSYHIAPAKWISDDGSGFTLVWSSQDRWNTIRGEFELKEILNEPHYAPNLAITGIEWAPASNIIRLAEGSDNWPVTWGDDDELYTAYGDGWGFDPKVPHKLSLGFAKISGSPPAIAGVNIRSSGEQTGDGRSGKKASGMLMVNGTLYMWVRNADNNGNQCQLAWSSDHAENWNWSGWKFEQLGYCAFLNFGKNYSGARDQYIYMYSPNTSSAYVETDEMILARVLVDQITVQSAYEFFRGFDSNNNPLWTKDFAQRGSVLVFPGGINRLDATYDAPLNRYLLTLRSRASGGGVDQVSIHSSPEPWGPWTTIFYTEDWDVDPGESQHIPSKWIGSDGRTFYMVFSGNDSFSVRKGTLILSSYLNIKSYLPIVIQ